MQRAQRSLRMNMSGFHPWIPSPLRKAEQKWLDSCKGQEPLLVSSGASTMGVRPRNTVSTKEGWSDELEKPGPMNCQAKRAQREDQGLVTGGLRKWEQEGRRKRARERLAWVHPALWSVPCKCGWALEGQDLAGRTPRTKRTQWWRVITSPMSP